MSISSIVFFWRFSFQFDISLQYLVLTLMKNKLFLKFPVLNFGYSKCIQSLSSQSMYKLFYFKLFCKSMLIR